MPSPGSVLENVLEEAYTLFPVVLVGSNTPIPTQLSRHLPYRSLNLSPICVDSFINIISTCGEGLLTYIIEYDYASCRGGGGGGGYWV